MSETAESELRSAAEAILIVADEPVTISAIAEALGMEGSICEELFESLAAEYRGEAPDSHAHGFLLRRTAGGWRFAPVPEYTNLVEQFIIGGATAHLSQAALEILAVVAYRQPVTRGRAVQIRGVNVDGVMRTLRTRGLIEEAGVETSGAILYRTTRDFLKYLGIDSLDELLPLAPYLPRIEALGEIVEQVDEMVSRRTPRPQRTATPEPSPCPTAVSGPRSSTTRATSRSRTSRPAPAT